LRIVNKKPDAMKKNNSRRYVFVTFLLLNSLFFGNTAFSQTKERQSLQVSVGPADAENPRVRICIYNPEEKKVTISISNDIDVDYTVSTKELYFDQVFNLSEVRDGRYFFLITAPKERIRKELEITTVSYSDRKVNIE
jgi:hypothetical protein